MYQLSNVKVIRDNRTILDIDELTIDPKAFTIVLGHNGSGKSTLVNLLANLVRPDNGEVTLNGEPLFRYSRKDLARQVAYLPQKLPEVAGLNVEELVRLGRYPWRGLLSRWNMKDKKYIDLALEQTNIVHSRNFLADELSGGERQRAWIAMLLAQQSSLMILDEPTSALDIQYQYQILDLLKCLNQETGKGMIVILHDLNLAIRYATNVVALKHGRVAFEGEAKKLLNSDTLSELFSTKVRLINHPNHHSKVAVIC
ncbi:ABC transporter ATP-binding protein [Vibrio algarum]|uniref:ABC transporter ATP-binding protein n=1 Tax=Vibrio algarum TaxID=3020714 RepID=A0ABT4YX15_9VIBR|nr:ABC transporter ATP-binding protein [Vibrio sp. KJ40-1]MDB1125706.1 ABC transporter ATP-binding protein [Vibrio sp. KJ40-1]